MNNIVAVNGALSAAICIIFYSLAIYKYRQTAIAHNMSNDDENRNIEFRLMLTGLLTFVVMIFVVVLVIMQIVVNTIVYLYVWPYVHTMFCMLSPWMLLICSRTLRESMFDGIVAKFKKSSNQVNAIALY